MGPLDMTNRAPPTVYAVLLTPEASEVAAFKTENTPQSVGREV
jgi:hypothetical protein